MRITVDTNVLVRALVEDDPVQAAVAKRVLATAEVIAVPVPVLCELVWVLRTRYKLPPADIADAIDGILDIDAVVTVGPAVQSGLRVLRAGGDFADGVIAGQGAALGGEVFVSFDRAAVQHWNSLGPGMASDPADLAAERG